MKFYRLYITKIVHPKTNEIMVYIGQRQSKFENPEEDSYFGSGKILKSYVSHYGKETLKLKTNWVEEFESKEALDEAEKELISIYKSQSDVKCLNVHEGGTGGDCYLHMDADLKKSIIEKRNKAISVAIKLWHVKNGTAAKPKPKVYMTKEEISKKIRDGLKRAGVTPPPPPNKNDMIWSLPLKRGIYDKWVEFGSVGYTKVTNYFNDNGYEFKRQGLLRLITEFKESGFIEPK